MGTPSNYGRNMHYPKATDSNTERNIHERESLSRPNSRAVARTLRFPEDYDYATHAPYAYATFMTHDHDLYYQGHRTRQSGSRT